MVALGEMAAGMAHELRNPLAAISGSVQFLKGELNLGGETLNLMDIILRESQRLDQAIRDFLAFARPGEFSAEVVSVVRLLEDNVKLLEKSRVFNSGHRIETHYDTPEICWRVDPNRMKQVFWNLATNALKSMPDGGALSIAVRRDPDDGQLVIRFSDEGTGMSEEECERYFQPFSGSFGEGTGLGAAIVYRVVQEHNGRITLDSAPGHGTSVSIRLPDLDHLAADESPALRAVGG
jgi:signal transduction histidine kinase